MTESTTTGETDAEAGPGCGCAPAEHGGAHRHSRLRQTLTRFTAKPCCEQDAGPVPSPASTSTTTLSRVRSRMLEKPCCDGDDDAAPVAAGQLTVALVGNPNVGKSTLFNALTGARQHVGNWPGKTVHVARGSWQRADSDCAVVDLPGTYSLLPDSPDEELTRDLLVDRTLDGRPDVVVVVADASNLARNLYLLSQVMDTGIPLVVALSMGDVARTRGLTVDETALARALGCPVVPVLPRSGRGLDELATAVRGQLDAPAAPATCGLGDDFESAVGSVIEAAVAEDGRPDRYPPRWWALSLLTEDGAAPAPAGIAAVAEGESRRLLDAAAAEEDDPDLLPDAETLLAERRYAWAHDVLERVVRRAGAKVAWTDRVDRVLTSRWFGIPIFLAVMWGVFEATTTVAVPLQDGLGYLIEGPFSSWVGSLLDVLHAPGWLSGLVLNGLVSGVGQLLSFVPLMAIMFVLLALLEDSGYMARGAFVVDRLMRMIGLPGKAFLPIIVGFGCNVPALSGTRVLRDRRHRLLLSLIIPYVSCSARLTVYVLLAGIFFGSQAGTMVFAMYVLSILLVIGMGLLLRRTLFRGMSNEPLVLELPPYRLPTLRVVGTQSWQKLAGFLRTASGIIVATVTAVWLLSAVPMGGNHQFGSVPVGDSVFGGVSQAVSPAFAPAGFDDWHASAALVTGFVAKEAVVSTMAQTYSAESADAQHPGSLGPSLRQTFDRASGGNTVPAVLAFMVFLLAYTPCMTTVATQRAQIGTRYTLYGMAIQIAVAWCLAVLVFQVGSLLW